MKQCACAECGHEQPTMDRCEICHSFKVVLVSVIEQWFGPDWRAVFEPTSNEQK